MSPLLTTPVTRRDAITSLLAMPALVMGAADVAAEPIIDSPGDTAQPRPESTVNWGAQVRLSSNDDHLPLRHLDIEAELTFDGRCLRLHLFQYPEPAWIDGIEQPVVPLGDFAFIGNPAAMFDRLSSDADREWLRKQQRWVEHAARECPTCFYQLDRSPTCATCGGRRWVDIPRADAAASVEAEHAERLAMIAAAVAAVQR